MSNPANDSRPGIPGTHDETDVTHSPASDAAPQRPVRVSRNALDVLLKLEAEQLVALLPSRFDLHLAPIVHHLPSELPQLDLHLEELDRVFELADGVILDLEIEADLRRQDLERFVGYGLALLRFHPDREVLTVALCGARTRQVPDPIDLHPIPYRLVCVLIGTQDGAATLARLRALVADRQPWSATDRLDLVLLPLMRQEQDTEAVVREGLALAEALPADEQRPAMAALLALAYHYAGEDALARLLEELMSTSLLDRLFNEKLEQRFSQGVAQGVAQGREEGERTLLRHYLSERFGPIPPPLEARIGAADAAGLTALFDRALKAADLDALLADAE